MKFLATALVLLGAANQLATAQDTGSPDDLSFSLPESTDAVSYLSELYSNQGGIPTGVTGAVVTSLASALYSVQKSFATHSLVTSDASAILSAAAKATDASAVLSSIEENGYGYAEVTAQPWYKDNVPEDVKSDVAQFNSAWDSAFDSVVKATSTKNAAAAAPACTGLVMAAAAGAAVGVMANL
ncbi:hypothetical protein B0T17DRAFT_381803 [Bombardia bombarda]|uniref:Uncharacterized protein n=1 Tax=Bombardia bombarda TaxID=252184 RepID=A0AA40BVL6_9PEZI|nr:hypothetical protein B0T17DRAFT_381803 [Bombardia bombarda]